MHYSEFPDAPASGTPLCADRDIRTQGVFVAAIGAFPYLVVQTPQGPRAYVNLCPHRFLPLDHRAEGILGADGALLCSNHDGKFDATSGAGIRGPALGCRLIPVPLRPEGENWVLA